MTRYRGQDVAESDWASWHWQLRNAVRDFAAANEVLAEFTDARIEPTAETEAIARDHFSFKITPYMFAALRSALEAGVEGAWDAFRAAFVPVGEERARGDGTEPDSIGEEDRVANPVPALTHFYEDRALLRVTLMCPAYCRYCFRRRMVGDGIGAWDEAAVSAGIDYIASTPAVREVILSGGDPMVLSDERLETILERLSAIPHVRRLRIDTKALTMMPQRFTADLVAKLRRFAPLYVVGHFTHLSELGEETRAACARLVDGGIPVGAHTPLLRGISDDAHKLRELFEELVDIRVLPYYLIHYIATPWTEHFRVPLQKGLDIVKELQRTSGGLANPTYIVYLPHAAGKVQVNPNYIVARTDDGWVFEAADGRQVLFPEPASLRLL